MQAGQSTDSLAALLAEAAADYSDMGSHASLRQLPPGGRQLAPLLHLAAVLLIALQVQEVALHQAQQAQRELARDAEEGLERLLPQQARAHRTLLHVALTPYSIRLHTVCTLPGIRYLHTVQYQGIRCRTWRKYCGSSLFGSIAQASDTLAGSQLMVPLAPSAERLASCGSPAAVGW